MTASLPLYRSTPVLAPILVVGCGGASSADDAAGLLLARRLSAAAGSEIELAAASGVAWDQEFSQRSAILVLDSVITGAPAGTIHIAPLPSTLLQPRHLGELAGSPWELEQMIQSAADRRVSSPRMAVIALEIERLHHTGSLSPAVSQSIAWAESNFEFLLTLVEATEQHLVRLIPPRFVPRQLRFELKR